MSIAKCYFRTGKFVIHVQCEFQKHINTAPQKLVPNRSTTLNWIKNFYEITIVSNKNPSSCLRSARVAQKMCNSLQISSRHSVEKWAQLLGLSCGSVHQILCHYVHYHPFELASH